MAASDVFGIVGTTQAGNFHVERVVAEGGFGVVYRAQHGAFRAPVALKCLKIPEQMTKQQRAVFLEKFREEAELMFRLSAAITEVVRPLHVDVLQLPDGRFVPFLALEWLEGESLDGIITRRREQGQAPLGLHKVVKMLRPVASALSRAHRFPGPQGAISIIHRDLKPENIFVASIGGSESMKILDFGIAKAKRAASQAVGRITGRTLEEDESASFTPAYGAPEQWSPKTYGETGPWTDVWGLSLSTVEALCGMPPIDGDTYVMRRVCLDEKRRPTPRNMGADVPVEIERVFERALAVDPRKRFKDIEGFWSELEIAMGIEPSLRTRDARREPAESTPVAEKIGPGLTTTGQKLAKIDLLKMPSTASMPAVRLQGDPRPAAKLISEVPVGLAPPAPQAAPNPGALRAPPSAPERQRPPPVKQRPPLPSEDFSSLDALEAPPSPRKPPVRRASIGMEMPLPSRISSADLELSLPLHPDGAPPPASGPRELDPAQYAMGSHAASNADPVHFAMAPQSSPNPGPPSYAPPPDSGRMGAPRVPMQRRYSGELELSLPLHDDGPPPPAVHSAPPAMLSQPQIAPEPRGAPLRKRSFSDLELSLPMRDAEPAPQDEHPPSSAPERPRDFTMGPQAGPNPGAAEPRQLPRVQRPDDAIDFDLGAAPVKSAPSAPAAPSGLDLAVPRPNSPGTLVTRVDDRTPLTLRERLTAPLTILLASLAIALVAFAFQKLFGNPLTLGPVRLTWIAGPLALFGVGFLLFRLIGVHDDD